MHFSSPHHESEQFSSGNTRIPTGFRTVMGDKGSQLYFPRHAGLMLEPCCACLTDMKLTCQVRILGDEIFCSMIKVLTFLANISG